MPNMGFVCVKQSEVDKLRQLGSSFAASTFDWGQVKGLGVFNRCSSFAKACPGMTCGKILAFASDEVTCFREKMGIKLCVFKVGVSSNPITRFASYQEQGFTAMNVIWVSDSVDLVHMLEAALVLQFHQHIGCRNQKGTGGEGSLNRKNRPPPPYYVYVTGGRADQFRRVG